MNLFPTQYSTLSAKALNEHIEQAYDLDDLSTKFLLRGVSDTYVASKDTSKYIFKVYRNSHRSLEEIKGEVELLNMLKSHKAKVSHPIADQTGNYIQTFNTGEGDRYGVLFSFAHGKAIKNLSDDQLKIVGREMAFNHNITSTIELNNERPEYSYETTIHKPLTNLKSAFAEYHYQEGYEYLQAIAHKTMNHLEGMNKSQFSQGYCHYDYLPKNFHFSENDDFTLFDFDFAGKGFLVNDLMSFQVHYFFQILYGGVSKDESDRCMQIFIQAYRKHRMLSQEEQEAIPYLGILFWIFYLDVQYTGYDDFSNHYFNLNYLKNWVHWIEEWERLYCKF